MTDPPTKRRRLDMTETFVVCAGKEAKEFIVYKNIAIRSSKFLQAAMDHDWKEAREKRVLLPDTESHVFEGYLQWLFTGYITVSPLSARDWQYADFYVLGDFLDDLDFRNATMDCIIKRNLEANRLPGPKAIKSAWDHTPPGSPLQTLILKLWSAYSIEWGTKELFEVQEDGLHYPVSFIGDYFRHVVKFQELAKPHMSTEERAKLMEEFKAELSADEVGVVQQ